jgi:recombination DNA repair RAD52 pathway protein
VLTEAQLNILFKPLNPVRVSKREGKFSYLETWDVIAHLGRMFGPDNWDDDTEYGLAFESERVNSQTGVGTGKWDVAYHAKCVLTVRDPEGLFVCTKSGVATGSAQNQSRIDAHDLAIKSATSDSLKRAAIKLGNQFGISLYDDGKTDSVLGSSLAHPTIKPKAGEWVWQEYDPDGELTSLNTGGEVPGQLAMEG